MPVALRVEQKSAAAKNWLVMAGSWQKRKQLVYGEQKEKTEENLKRLEASSMLGGVREGRLKTFPVPPPPFAPPLSRHSPRSRQAKPAAS